MEQDGDMDSDNNMAEKVINHLSLLLKNSNLIEDFSIIPSTSSFDCNISPVHYVEVEHCFGLESWCVKHVFKYSQAQILKSSKCILKRPSIEGVNKLNMYLNVALLILPEVNTFWNIKRELNAYLQHDQEIQLSKLVLSNTPKSLQAYTYRVWLINNQADCDYSLVLQNEFIVINKAVEASANNYHGWNHRIWCMEKLLPKCSDCLDPNIIVNELHYSYEFVNQHVSDHSGFHYRQYLLRQFKERFCFSTEKMIQLLSDFKYVDYCKFVDIYCPTKDDAYLNLLLNELLEVCKQLNQYYPGHEAIWYHRRFILHEIVMLFHNTSDKTSGGSNENCYKQYNERFPLMQKSKVYKNLVAYEKKFLSFLDEQNVKNLCDSRYLGRHRRWLNCRLNLDLKTNFVLTNGELLFKL